MNQASLTRKAGVLLCTQMEDPFDAPGWQRIPKSVLSEHKRAPAPKPSMCGMCAHTHIFHVDLESKIDMTEQMPPMCMPRCSWGGGEGILLRQNKFLAIFLVKHQLADMLPSLCLKPANVPHEPIPHLSTRGLKVCSSTHPKRHESNECHEEALALVSVAGLASRTNHCNCCNRFTLVGFTVGSTSMKCAS